MRRASAPILNEFETLLYPGGFIIKTNPLIKAEQLSIPIQHIESDAELEFAKTDRTQM